MIGHLSPAATRTLRDACKQGIVDTVIPQFDDADLRLFNYVRQSRLFPRPRKNADWPRTWKQPSTQQYYEHIYPWIHQPAALPEWLVETARFPVPYGSQGVLKCIDMSAQSGTINVTVNGYWGRIHITGASEMAYSRWFFRLSNFDGTQPPRHESNDQNLPGMPFGHLHELRYFTYPLSAGDNYIHAVIPGGYMLRMFFWARGGGGTDRWSYITGRLRGYIQSGYNEEAAHNARSGW